MKVLVRAGQLFRAKAHRGHRLVRIVHVRGVRSDNSAPYALAREVLPSGKPAQGTSRLGLPRDNLITIYLVGDGAGRLTLPPAYEEQVEIAEAWPA